MAATQNVPPAAGLESARQVSRRKVLTEDEQARLLDAASHGIGRRDVVITLLALRAGIDAREQSRMDVGHVGPAGPVVPAYVIVPGRRAMLDPSLPPQAVPIPESLRRELGSHVEAIRAYCRHGDGRFGKDVRPDGVPVCHVCGLPLELARVPLLLSRSRDRLSERQIHKVFARAKERAGLDASYTFGALVRTYEARVRALVIRAIQSEV
jgi:hypothetical protein